MSEVQLPALGESVTEGTITRWLKNVGDTVAVDEPLVEVSTDKVDTEIPSPVAGVLQEIKAQEDETVEVGAVLAVIGEGAATEATPEPSAPAEAEQPEPAAPVAESPTPVAEPVTETPVAETPAPADPTPPPAPPVATPPQPPVAETPVAAPVAPPAPPAAPVAPVATDSTPTEATESDSAYVTPIVRKLAKDNGVDLNNVKGTGIGGRIRKEDVEALIGQTPSAASSVSQTAAPAEIEISPLRGTTEQMSRLRKVLASKAVESMQSSAQLTSVVEVDVTKIAELRKAVQSDFIAKTGVKLSFMPFFNLAAAEALKAHPKINSTIDGESIVYHPTENISFAVDTDRGLLTPVIRNASELTIAETAKQISNLAERTRNNQLTPDELSGGTFTLTNTGSRGALFDTPVVFMPQSAILGTGIVTKRPVVMQSADGSDVIAIRSMVYLALSYDHRNIDGADAARYLTAVKQRLEAGAFEGQLGI
ncbi:MAG: 2-oxoglutarate dehydrogenase, E2 component, dihydrolipoamide succinyltransferase [Microbacteriaceae bacterium]|nr:2-oxoglutarate dehydrogenase, E2 component, dihydrolipoamide succinyltransferase [Microbacteriaceae bacterium]MDR9443540.1 2-oxoglutarate dehydrogenase, E2 component, dihydrolipoamide succinyltransferase [Microbacteriaceae bacterium]